MSSATLTGYQDYAVGPEDLLEILFYGQDDLNRETRVNGQGEITLPLVETVKVAGQSPQQIEKRLAQLYKEGEFIKQPQLTVTVKEYRHQRVMITGAVMQPGAHELIGPRTLLEMLGKAGGLSDKAGDMVQIIRSQSASDRGKAMKLAPSKPFSPGSETIVIDLRRLLSGSMELNFPIKNGDVIHVPFAQMAYVLGAVRKPGEIPLKTSITVSQAVAMSQGLDPVLASDNISILRFDEDGQRITIPVDLDKVTSGIDPDPVLKENDVVFVKENVIRRFFYDFKNLFPGSFGASVPIF